MKNILSAIVMMLAFSANVFSQCTPIAATGNPGLSPAPASVACIERGVPYDFTLNFENFSSFNCSGFSVTVNSATIDDLDNLPCGISWQADQTSYSAGETGCIRITGTSTDVVGQYPLTVSMTFDLNILGSSYTVSGTIPDLIQQMTAVGCGAPSINTNYFSRVIDPGTCPAIGTLPNGTSSGTTCPPTLQIGVSISGNTTICNGSSTSLTANVTNSTGTVTYAWSSGGNTASVNVSPTTTTSYTITVTDQNGSATTSTSVTVNQRPNAAFTASPSGASATVSNTTTGATSYAWNFGDSQTSTAQNPPAHTYSSNGTFTITLIATNSCGNDTATQTINICFQLNTSAQTPPDICIVGVDSATGKNIIVWEKPSTVAIDSYIVYKETSQAGVYEIIGAQDFNAFSTFIDMSSNPNQSANRYKLEIIDSCGSLTLPGSLHKTIHLTINQGVGTSWNLIWSHYEGLTFWTYNIYRGTSVSNLSQFDSIASNLNSFTDLNPPTGVAYYQIEVVNPNQCNPSARMPNYSASRSNIVNTTEVGIANIAMNSLMLKISPNPFNSAATVEIENLNGSFDYALYTITGLKVDERIGISERTFTIQKDALAQGVYFIEVRTENMLGRKKLVIY